MASFHTEIADNYNMRFNIGGISLIISLVETKTVPTIKIEMQNKSIIFHSQYDPLREAHSWAQQSIKDIDLQTCSEIIILGIGAGYHIKALAEIVSHIPIKVIELNQLLFDWFIKSPLYENISKLKNIKIDSLNYLPKKDRDILFSRLSSSNIFIHKSELDILPKEYEKIKEILIDIQFKKNSIRNQIIHLNENFPKNISLKDEGILKNHKLYSDKPMILISAGPSLDKQIPLLRKIYLEDQFVLGAVGTALKPLMKHGIIPHFYAIIDANPGNEEQITGLNLENITLYYLSTAYHKTVSLHSGPRYILWQNGYKEAEEMASIRRDPLIETGGSVATALLSLMTYLSSGPIALIGQDLAYTNGFSHAAHTHAQKKLVESETFYSTLNYEQTGSVPTARNLITYRKWFEDFAEQYNHLELYNCTEGGAYIKNWKYISFKTFYEYASNRN